MGFFFWNFRNHTKLRVLLYLMQVASDDEETQKQGIVFIFMLALRAVTGHHHQHVHSSTSSVSLTTSAVAAAVASSSTTTTSSTIPSDNSTNNIFARTDSADSGFGCGSATSSDNDIAGGGSNLNDSTTTTTFSPYETSHRHNHTMKRIRILSKVFRYGPVRVGAIHVCSPNRPELQHIKFDLLQVLEKNERVRTKFHNGMFICNMNVILFMSYFIFNKANKTKTFTFLFHSPLPLLLHYLLSFCLIHNNNNNKRNINGMFYIIESSGDTNRSFTT
jgi:hypothetical protein